MSNENTILIIDQPSTCSRQVYLELCIEKLLEHFTDMSYEDISDSLEYYADEYRRKVGREK